MMAIGGDGERERGYLQCCLKKVSHLLNSQSQSLRIPKKEKEREIEKEREKTV
jgi:hypothetical protein